MQVAVRLFGSLRRFQLHETSIELEGGTTVGGLLDRAEIPTSEVAIVLVNGIHAELEQPLQDGETIALFPPIAGG